MSAFVVAVTCCSHINLAVLDRVLSVEMFEFVSVC